MIYVAAASWLVTCMAILFAARCYRELWRWARQCQNAQIAIAYKRKVKIVAPLVEWLLWCNRLDAERDIGGRTIYSLGGTDVALIRGDVSVKRSILRSIGIGRSTNKRSRAPGARQGSWSATDDKTGVKGGVIK